MTGAPVGVVLASPAADQRKIFEQWYFEGAAAKAAERNPDGEYKYMPASVAWHTWQAAWQAACDAMCVEVKATDDRSSENAG